MYQPSTFTNTGLLFDYVFLSVECHGPILRFLFNQSINQSTNQVYFRQKYIFKN